MNCFFVGNGKKKKKYLDIGHDPVTGHKNNFVFFNLQKINKINKKIVFFHRKSSGIWFECRNRNLSKKKKKERSIACLINSDSY